MKLLTKMMTVPIIKSILDNDLYKFTMMQAVFHQYRDVEVEYDFKCRNKGQRLGHLAEIVRCQIDLMVDLQLQVLEKAFLQSKIRFLTPDFIEFLSDFRFDPLTVTVINDDGELRIHIKGKWVNTILWEVPILAIVSEAYFCTLPNVNLEHSYQIGREKLAKKIELINFYHLPINEMGTRRRFTREWQDEMVSTLARECSFNDFRATSNVFLAMKHNIKAMGTMAHEWIMAHLSLVSDISQAQKRALHVWQQEFIDDLGIALSDTFGTDAFYRDFDTVLSRSYSGPRHDSGDPYAFGYKTIDHYKEMDIDPTVKVVTFSDGLKINEKIIVPLFLTFVRYFRINFGVGTDLSNDLDYHPLNIVIKMSSCQGKPVVKLSDVEGKEMGDPEMIKRVKAAYPRN
ncbi:MAG: nicotinate phosphoribosyltransferase [Bacteriovorax sp.]|nr:nicotinate phosphoribosyltransferase [Bacteriovorax sp.]